MAIGSPAGRGDWDAYELRKRIAYGRYATNRGRIYKQNDSEKELIGVTNAILFWASESGVDNSPDDSGNSGLHLDSFDTSTRADSAKISLLNDSGDTQYVIAVAIKAKPITRLSGEQGFLHDSFVDYEDIFQNGENTFEFGNNFVVTKAQLEQLADYYAKMQGVIATSGNRKAKHLYACGIPGRCLWFEPGEWYTLQVGGVGQREYIDAVVECYDVTVEAAADDLGVTNITFREVEQNWVKDSNAVARFLASGDPRWKPNNFGRVVVAARDYLGTADYYCPGTADQTEIQAAINYLANGFDGGVVELTEGQFNITVAIDLNYNNMMLMGHGAKTIIEKNCNDYAIDMAGTVGNIKSNITLSDVHIKTNAADTNNIEALRISYNSDVKVQMCFFSDTYAAAIDIYDDCQNSVLIARNTFTNCGLYYNCYVISNRYRSTITNNIGFANKALLGTIGCPVFGASGVLIQSNKVYDNWGIGITPASDAKVVDNYAENNAQFNEDTLKAGIDIESAGWENVSVISNDSLNNGSLLAYGRCEDATTPYIIGDASSVSNATAARSDEQEYDGTYSLKHTITATGSISKARFCDNETTTDKHGLFAGETYALFGYVYIPSTGGPAAAEVEIHLEYYDSGAWNSDVGTAAAGQDAWELVTTGNIAIPATATGVRAYVSIADSASNGEYCYWDNLRLKPISRKNLHEQNFHDVGTGTHIGV